MKVELTEVRFKEFLSLIEKTDTCWNWVGYLDGKGYGGFFYQGKMRRSHRVSLSIFRNTEVNDSLEVLHSCDNKKCVNPSHLKQGTHKDNMSEMSQRKRQAPARKTHCKRGHPLSGDNLYEKSKFRDCKKCRKGRDDAACIRRSIVRMSKRLC